MPIDNCRYTFTQLTSEVLPLYMSELKARMASPSPLSDFAVGGVGVATLLRKFGLRRDFAGCYVFLDGEIPVYVGISRTVFQRLRQHVRGTTHFDASLAYRIASRKQPHSATRSDAMANATFREEFVRAQKYLEGLNVAFVEIDSPLELYLFEVFCAMELDTCAWNTFETH